MPESITCAVIMKMMRRTSTTSTNGVTLISESAVVPWNRRRPDVPPLLTVIAIGSLPVGALGQVKKFEREVVHAGAHFLDDVAEVVVGDRRGNSREQADGGGNQSFRNPGADGAEARGALQAQLFEGADDAEDRSKQSDKRTDRRRCREPAHVAFQFGQFFAGAELQSALDGDGVVDGAARLDLAGYFLVPEVEQHDQRSGAELFAGHPDGIQPVGLAERPQEPGISSPGPAKRAPLGEDDGPGEYRKDQ